MKAEMWRYATEYHQSGSFADPNSRVHKPELRSYACLIYEQQVILLLSYLTVDKTVSTVCRPQLRSHLPRLIVTISDFIASPVFERGCHTSNLDDHKIGCHVDDSLTSMTCYCDTDRCNGLSIAALACELDYTHH